MNIGAYVANDVPAAARLATEHLLDQGCRNIVFLNADRESRFIQRIRAAPEGVSEDTGGAAGRHTGPNSVFHAGLDIESGLPRWARCGNASRGWTVCSVPTPQCPARMEAARGLGMQVPRDIAFVGVDDLDICRLESVSLTAIRQPYEQLAKIATEILVEAIEADRPPSLQLSLKPEIVIRTSSRRREFNSPPPPVALPAA